MKQQKPNKRVQNMLALVLVLCLGLLVVSVGTALARYQAERQKGVVFQVREPEMVLLGTIKDEQFTAAEQLTWKTENGVTSLQFAVANGTSDSSYSTRDQRICLRMIGTLGILTDSTPPELSVTFTPQKGNEEEKTVKASVSPIVEGSALYHSYGHGWLYTFMEQTYEGYEELSWELLGDELSYIALTITIEGQAPDNLSLLQPMVVAEAIGK